MATKKYPPGTGFGGAPRPAAAAEKPVPKYAPGTGFGGQPRPNPALVESLVDKPIPKYDPGTGFGGAPRPGPLGTKPLAGRRVDAPPGLLARAKTATVGGLKSAAATGGRAVKGAAPFAAGAAASHVLKDDSPDLAAAASGAGIGAGTLPFAASQLARVLPGAAAGGRLGRLGGPLGMLIGGLAGGAYGLMRGAPEAPAEEEEPAPVPNPTSIRPETMMAYQALIQQYLQPYVENMLAHADAQKADAAYWADKVPASYGRALQASNSQTDALQRQLANSFMVSAQQMPALWAYDQLARQPQQPSWTAGVGAPPEPS